MPAEDLVIRGPAGSGKVACISRDDVARVVATVLLAGDKHDGQMYNDTGPESLSMAEIADVLSGLTGRQVEYEEETIDAAWESRQGFGAPDWQVEAWVTSYIAIATGEMDVVTDAVEKITGKSASA